MRRVDFWIEDKKLDLFQEEQIKITSKIADYKDIGKIFTDYSQSFTVPASDNNNSIFEYYYNNDLDGTIDHNLRRASRLEIDLDIFRTGKAQLEKGVVVKGQAEYYTATFYGEFVTLKDKIGEDKLGDLDYSSIDHAYTEIEVFKRVKGDIVDSVKYPLITSKNNWTYGDLASTDITTVAGKILHSDLFPAVTFPKIFELIQLKYGLTFSGGWLSSENFKRQCLWFKNKNQIQQISKPYDLVNDSGENFTNGFIFSELFYTYRNPATVVGGDIRHSASVQVNTTSTFDYYLDVFKNGLYVITLTKWGGGNNFFQVVTLQQNNPSLSESYTFKIRSKGVATFTGSINYSIQTYEYSTGYNIESYSNPFNSITTSITTNLQIYAPEIKVLDFLRSVMQSAQLTVVGLNETDFVFMPLNEYYNSGRNIDITPYVVTDLIEYKRPSLFSEIDFKYQKSESILNTAFFDLFGRNYGDLRGTFPYDGGKFDVQLGFETLLHQKFTGTGLQVGYCINKDLQPYVPKPVVLTYFDKSPGIYEVYLGGTAYTGDYIPFGQDLINSGTNYTLNWNIEVSSWTENPEPNGLYSTYYEPYLLNLFNKKTRVVSLDVNFPQSLIIDLKLNDKVIVRDKKYIINSLQTNLNTGDMKMELLSWWNIDDNSMIIKIGATEGEEDIFFEVGDGSMAISRDGIDFGSFSDFVDSSADVRILAFQKRAKDDGGTFEAYNCLEEYRLFPSGTVQTTFTYPTNTTGVERTEAVNVTATYYVGGVAQEVQSQLIITQEG